MKKKIWIPLLATVAILMIGTSFVISAASAPRNPAEVLADLTGKSVQDIREDRRDGFCFAAQAQEAGVLPEFQNERLAICEERLDSAVADGRMTREDADKILAEMKLRQESFDGTGIGPEGQNGPGYGLRDGTCIGSENPNGPSNGPKDGTGKGMGPGIGCRAVDND
jgi:hypothetical protein